MIATPLQQQPGCRTMQTMGGPRRSVRLRVIGGSVELRDDVPGTRAECPTQRPCPHVRCVNHLFLVDGRDRPGRRHEGRTPASTLRPIHMMWPLPPSCLLDVRDQAIREDWTVAEIARALGLSTMGLWYQHYKALAKLEANRRARELYDESGDG